MNILFVQPSEEKGSQTEQRSYKIQKLIEREETKRKIWKSSSSHLAPRARNSGESEMKKKRILDVRKRARKYVLLFFVA